MGRGGNILYSRSNQKTLRGSSDSIEQQMFDAFDHAHIKDMHLKAPFAALTRGARRVRAVRAEEMINQWQRDLQTKSCSAAEAKSLRSGLQIYLGKESDPRDLKVSETAKNLQPFIEQAIQAPSSLQEAKEKLGLLLAGKLIAELQQLKQPVKDLPTEDLRQAYLTTLQ